MSQVTLQGDVSGTGIFTVAAPNSNTNRTLTLPDNSGTVITTATTTGINASELSTGTVATARLASGTADSTTFLRGDQTWQPISTTPTTDQVLTATAGATAGAVGTYAFMGTINSATSTAVGATIAGSSLFFAGVAFRADSNLAVFSTSSSGSGTWRCVGFKPARANSNAGNIEATMFLRIS